MRTSAAALLAIVAALVGSLPLLARAQTGQNVPNALQGFSQNKGEPVEIKAATLEVRDKDKIATFSGDVHVKQGDTNLRSRTLLVFYDQEDNPKNMKSAEPGPKGQQQIRRLEARGNVVVTQKDQTATGDNAIFDMRTNTVTLTGNVLVTQGPNVLRGDKLIVDLTSGTSRVEGKGPVQMLIVPNSPDSKTGKSGGKDTPAGRPQSPRGLY